MNWRHLTKLTLNVFAHRICQDDCESPLTRTTASFTRGLCWSIKMIFTRIKAAAICTLLYTDGIMATAMEPLATTGGRSATAATPPLWLERGRRRCLQHTRQLDFLSKSQCHSSCRRSCHSLEATLQCLKACPGSRSPVLNFVEPPQSHHLLMFAWWKCLSGWTSLLAV